MLRSIRTSLLLLALGGGAGAVAAGCGGGGSGGGGAAAAAITSNTTGSTSSSGTGAVPTAATPAAGRWWSGDLHSHSAPYSQDADSQGGDGPGVCFFLAETAGLDYLALTDHRTMDQVNDPTYRANTLSILDGEEWGGAVHVGMVGLQRQVPEINGGLGAATKNAQVQAAWDDAHRQGGVVILNHPCQEGSESIWLSRSFDAIEVWNTFWNSLPKGIRDTNETNLDDKLRNEGLAQLGEDCTPELREAIRQHGGGGNWQALKLWEAHLNRGHKKAITGGGDRHMLVLPGMPTTHIYAVDKTRDQLIDGIKKCRTWVGAFQGPDVEFTADADGDGVFEKIIGDSAPLNVPVKFRCRVKNTAGGRIDVIKNGQTHLQFGIISADDTVEWTDTATARTWVRVDILEKIDWSKPQSNGFQLLATTGTLFGQNGYQALMTLAAPLGFQVSVGTRIPTVRLPREYEKVLNFDRMNWNWARGAITSPIWIE